MQEHKTLEEHLSEQRELYSIYKDEQSRALITLCANKIKELIQGEKQNDDRK